jgi:hypothetical protein
VPAFVELEVAGLELRLLERPRGPRSYTAVAVRRLGVPPERQPGIATQSEQMVLKDGVELLTDGHDARAGRGEQLDALDPERL